MKASEITAEKIASKDFGGSKGGTGGIISKLGAASDFVKQSGKPAWVAHGKKPGVVSKILRGEQVGTMIVPE